MKTRISDELADEIIKSLLNSRIWAAECEKDHRGHPLPKYRGHFPLRNETDGLTWYSHGRDMVYRLLPDEYDLRCVQRYLAEEKGLFDYGIDATFCVQFQRACQRLFRDKRLVLVYPGRKIVKRPTVTEGEV
jgi:hypothetical protein